MAGFTTIRLVTASTFFACLVFAAGGANARPLRVAATVPGLASLARSVGGDEVEVSAFVRGAQDAHFIEPRPSFIRTLSRADLFITIGLGLEVGWVPTLLNSARNSSVRPGGAGSLVASDYVPLRRSPAAPGGARLDRSQGDVHAGGNPHFLTDPIAGLRIADAIRARLIELRPEARAAFDDGYRAFARRLLDALYGPDWVRERGLDVAARTARDTPGPAADDPDVRGWFGRMRPYAGTKLVADHDLWPYFAARFDLEVAAFLEPLPGITPTTRHLSAVTKRIERDRIRVILSSAYFHPRYAKKVAKATGATIVQMANQVESRDGVDDYLTMIDWNVEKLAGALDRTPAAGVEPGAQ